MNEKKRTGLKNVEVRLIAELMKNCRRTDRELARVIGCSQPTVSRTIKRLEEKGIIREYAMIPDFSRLGYTIMGVTFIGASETEKEEERTKLRKAVKELEKKNPYASLMAVSGTGMRKDTMFITLYRDYTSYVRAMQRTRSLPHVDATNAESFLVDLDDDKNYRVLTMSQAARHFQSSDEGSSE